ncbi:MAG: methyltransferase domain-containing protein [Spirochaetes bacterium]|nr:methyltransferase domain-containing protein [Spirochaetota bacterium]
MKDQTRLLKTLKEAGIGQAVLNAFADVDRLKFFDPIFAGRVASPAPIPIGSGQSSDDAVILARMIAHLSLRKKSRVLEVGTGSGYSTAVLTRLAQEVVTIEYFEDLARAAKSRVIGEGYTGARFFTGDATDFDGPLGEFDAVLVTAACARTPYFLINTVKPGGIAVFPMGMAHQQQITRFTNDPDARKPGDNYRFYDLCSFDSIRGVYGWVDIEEPPPDHEPIQRP